MRQREAKKEVRFITKFVRCKCGIQFHMNNVLENLS